MKTFQTIVVVAATITLGVLLWKINLRQVGRYLSRVKWGMALILAQEIIAHCFNALAWRFTFRERTAKSFPFRELVKLRIAGDAVNYLTPSATIAGEFIRAIHLNASQSQEVRYASVAVAKFTQTIAQALFILSGIVYILSRGSLHLGPYQTLFRICALVLGSLLLALAAYGYWMWNRIPLQSPTDREAIPPPAAQDEARPPWLAAMQAVPRQCRGFFRNHPWRFAGSILSFMLGYAWGAFEAYWICRFLGVPVSVETALVIEVLSSFIDGVMFMVPAKLGTQEGGKTVIFSLLRFDPSLGFAFGVLRHIRELAWSGLGLSICALERPSESAAG